MPDQEERNEGAQARWSGSGVAQGDLVRAAPVELADTGAKMFGGFEDRYAS